MVYAEIDPRYADQHECGRADDPHQNSWSPALDTRCDNRRECAVETGAGERVSAGEAVGFRRQQVKERRRTSAFEREF